MGINEAQKDHLRLLGKRLQGFRTDKGLTLKQLGYLANKEPQSISRVEMGEINPTFLYLMEICKGLNIDLSDLFKEPISKAI